MSEDSVAEIDSTESWFWFLSPFSSSWSGVLMGILVWCIYAFLGFWGFVECFECIAKRYGYDPNKKYDGRGGYEGDGRGTGMFAPNVRY